jgi:hypothetical protein
MVAPLALSKVECQTRAEYSQHLGRVKSSRSLACPTGPNHTPFSAEEIAGEDLRSPNLFTKLFL